MNFIVCGPQVSPFAFWEIVIVPLTAVGLENAPLIVAVVTVVVVPPKTALPVKVNVPLAATVTSGMSASEVGMP